MKERLSTHICIRSRRPQLSLRGMTRAQLQVAVLRGHGDLEAGDTFEGLDEAE